MTTIAQLPKAASLGAGDLVPVSQAGIVYSATIDQLGVNLQPIISIASGALLGRASIGAGGPEAINVGAGLAIEGGALAATGTDHASFSRQTALTLTDDIVINSPSGPGLLPVTGLRSIFNPGEGIIIDGDGIISASLTGVVGPAGPPGAVGLPGPTGPEGPAGPSGNGLNGPEVNNTVGSIGESDYVPIWQNGALSWISYGQFISGQTIDELPAAAPTSDSDALIVAQGGNILKSQTFGSIWSYFQNKLSSVKTNIVELSSDTVLDTTVHNNRILIASSPLTLTGNFTNSGSGFFCKLINLSSGLVIMGSGISSGTGGATLPPGADTTLMGISYSGGSMIWWSGIISNNPTITVGTIKPLLANTPFIVSGGIFNDAPVALDYSIDGGSTWNSAILPVITENAYSFSIGSGLVAGTYSIRVRDHENVAVLGVSNSFIVQAPTIEIGLVPATVSVNTTLHVIGSVLPPGAAVRSGLSLSATTPPTQWSAATVSDDTWSSNLTFPTAGYWYVWAEQTTTSSVQAVSSVINAISGSLTILAPATGIIGSALTITGVVVPAGDAVSIALSSTNSTAPTTGWVATTNNGGNFSGSLTPLASGVYYAWARDEVLGLTNSAGVITVSAAPALIYGINNPGGTYMHGSGSITLTGSVSPAQNISTQVALSTSNTVAPNTGWADAVIQNYNQNWGLYYTTPSTSGNYYVWVQTATGANTIVSDFTISVT